MVDSRCFDSIIDNIHTKEQAWQFTQFVITPQINLTGSCR